MHSSHKLKANENKSISFICLYFPIILKAITAFLTICFMHSIAFAAETATPVKLEPIESFFKNPQFSGANLSPNGKYLAVKTALKGKMHLAVVDLDTRAVTHAAGFTDSDIHSFWWINNNRLLFNVIDRTSDQNNSVSGLFAVDSDGNNYKELMPTIRKQIDQLHLSYSWGKGTRRYHFVASYNNEAGDIVMAEDSYGEDSVSAYKLNTVTGRKNELLLSVPGVPTNFAVDNNQQVRTITTRGNGEKTDIVWYRDDESQSWRKLAELDTLKPAFQVIRFDADNKTMLVGSTGNKDKNAIYKYDFASNKLGEIIIDDADVDIDNSGSLILDNAHKLVGVRVNAEPPRTHWIDPAYLKVQEALDAAFPDQVNVIYSGDIKSRMVVYSYTSANPGKYSLFNPVSLKLEPLLTSRPWIKSEQMADQLIFNYAARDGLNIPSYLTIPKGRVMKKLPLVVLVHGGPWVRDHWGFNSEVQFLANRGYAVLQPQYRGSTGFGWSHYTKGWNAWGLAMQDDISDGVSNLVKQGVVDPARVCIMGASYGGYATLMGLVKDPSQYRCGINMFGVADIELQFSSGRGWVPESAKHFLATTVGNKNEMKLQFDTTSPIKQAGKIRAPLLMVYGKKDERVPIVHGEKMRKALKDNGTPVEWIELPEEEHGIALEENRYKVYGAVEEFLKKYNPAD